MLDTIKILAKVGLSKSRIDSILEDVKESTIWKTGEIFYTGWLRGLRVQVYPSHAILEGSLPKFAQGHNLFGMGFIGDVRALDELCGLLRVKPNDVVVWRIDVGNSLLISEQVSSAISLFGERSGFIRNTRRTSFTYTQSQRQFKGYDKVKEIAKAIRNGSINFKALPKGWRETNALRMEASLHKNLKAKIGMRTGDGSSVLVSDLCDLGTYARLVRLWEADYFAIQKRKIVTMDGKPALTGTRKMNQYLQMRGLIAEGEESILAGIQLEHDKKKRQRMKVNLRKLASISCYTEDSPLIQELDAKVREAALQALG